ncbi:serine protease inhibitor [Pseudarthrobacter sp. N5]|uniref:serine protease inhibitor n=1 Tax=Pseudarthrobacter sp. N5 TaxID=3418416 RepID=UPI003CF16A83
MRKLLIQAMLAVAAVSALAACTPGTGSGSGSGSAGPSASTSSSATAGSSPSATTPPDAETTVPAPAPSAPAPGSAGPGAGNAELSITVKPSETEPAVSYTLVCRDGVPAAESKHPTAAAACAALKNNAALLSPAPRGKDVACTQQYGGPQQANVTGIVDVTPVDTSFSRRDGCEISAWDAAKDILGAGGAV